MYFCDDLIQRNNNCIGDGFSYSVAAMLTCADGDFYAPLFKEQDIGVQDLSEMSDLDLIILGVDSATVRKKLLDVVKCLPKGALLHKFDEEKLTSTNIVNILMNNCKHLRRIVLSLKSNKLLLLKNDKLDDALLKTVPQFYSTDVILDCFERIESTISSTEKDLKTLKKTQNLPFSGKRKKIIIASVGGTIIIILTIGFMNSLKNI